jgi:hypothetical protein
MWTVVTTRASEALDNRTGAFCVVRMQLSQIVSNSQLVPQHLAGIQSLKLLQK